jgi:O-antigen/teichoic acid export membrane protein
MRLSQKIAYNTIIQIIGKALSTALGVASITIMARYLGKTGFGQYTIVMTYVSFFSVISDFGLTLVTSRLISEPGADEKKIISNLFGLRLVSALIFLGLAPLSIIFFPYDNIVKLGAAIITLSFLFNALSQILTGFFQKKLKMGIMAGADVLSRILLLAGIILSVKLNWGLYGILWSVVASNIFSFGFPYLLNRELTTFSLAFDKKIWLKIFHQTWPLAITIAFNLIYLKTDTLILSLIKSPAEVGVYGVAYKVIDILVTIPFMFSGLALPALTAAWARGEKEKFNSMLGKSFNGLAIMAVLLIIGAQFTAQPIMVLVAGEEFAAAGSILRILILAAGVIFLQSIFAHAIIAIGQQTKIIGAYAFTAVTALAAYLIFIPRYSYFGAAWSTVYSESAIAASSIYLIYKYVKFIPRVNILFKALLASIPMAGFLYILNHSQIINLYNWFGLSATIAIAGLIYFFFLYLLRGLDFLPWKMLKGGEVIKEQ